MSEISSLSLTSFRNYKTAQLNHLESGFVLLTGANGAGKTNILEAISLLTPGKGLRGADRHDYQSHHDKDTPWVVSAQIKTDFGIIPIGTGHDVQKNKRIVRINGVTAKAQTDLAEYFSCIWLTPQMDRLFLDPSSVRRKFLDRMVFAFDPSHAGRISRYERAMQERLKLLKEKRGDAVWFDALETQMAQTGIAIAAARLEMINRLMAAQNSAISHDFPLANVILSGDVEQNLSHQSAAKIEQDLRENLKNNRARDGQDGMTHYGVHRTDMHVTMRANDMKASECSTGEQKALLIGLVLSHAILLKAEMGRVPVLLLDEVMAHLDQGRRANLFAVLHDLGGQVFITATEKSLLDGVKNGQFWWVEQGQVLNDESLKKS